MFTGAGSSSVVAGEEALPPLPPPVQAPADARPLDGNVCADCQRLLDDANKSALPDYCKKCFAAEAALNLVGRPYDPYTQCMLCAGQISAETTSPVPGRCFECYEQQDAIQLAMQQAAQPVTVAEETHAAEPARQPLESLAPEAEPPEPTSVLPPEGWRRRKKESEQDWFARVQKHRHQSQAQQKQYREQWKSFDEGHRERFRSEVESLAGNSEPKAVCDSKPVAVATAPEHPTPWLQVTDGKRSVALPAGFSASDLKVHFDKFA